MRWVKRRAAAILIVALATACADGATTFASFFKGASAALSADVRGEAPSADAQRHGSAVSSAARGQETTGHRAPGVLQCLEEASVAANRTARDSDEHDAAREAVNSAHGCAVEEGGMGACMRQALTEWPDEQPRSFPNRCAVPLAAMCVAALASCCLCLSEQCLRLRAVWAPLSLSEASSRQIRNSPRKRVGWDRSLEWFVLCACVRAMRRSGARGPSYTCVTCSDINSAFGQATSNVYSAIAGAQTSATISRMIRSLLPL
jgi:hypothetical protein